MHTTLVTAAQRVLTQLVAHVNAQRPAARGTVSQFQLLGRTQVCASFLQSSTGQLLDLCVTITSHGGAMALAADVVRGGSGELLSELDPTVISDEMDLAAALRTLERYVWDQGDIIIAAVG